MSHEDEGSVDLVDAISEITIPDFRNIETNRFYDYENIIQDYESLESLGAAINAARLALFKVTDLINKYERRETKARDAYDKAYRRAYINSSEKTDAGRKIRADLLCEELEDKLIVAKQVKNELIRISSNLRAEMQTLDSIGHNMRQQLKL